MLQLQDIAVIFRLIGGAVKSADEAQFRVLNKLTVALEHAYPDEMRALREESLLNDEPCLHDRATHDGSGAYCPDCGATGTFPFGDLL